MFTAILQIAANVLANLINSRKCSNERADSLNVGVLRAPAFWIPHPPRCSKQHGPLGAVRQVPGTSRFGGVGLHGGVCVWAAWAQLCGFCKPTSCPSMQQLIKSGTQGVAPGMPSGSHVFIDVWVRLWGCCAAKCVLLPPLS